MPALVCAGLAAGTGQAVGRRTAAGLPAATWTPAGQRPALARAECARCDPAPASLCRDLLAGGGRWGGGAASTAQGTGVAARTARAASASCVTASMARASNASWLRMEDAAVCTVLARCSRLSCVQGSARRGLAWCQRASRCDASRAQGTDSQRLQGSVRDPAPAFLADTIHFRVWTQVRSFQLLCVAPHGSLHRAQRIAGLLASTQAGLPLLSRHAGWQRAWKTCGLECQRTILRIWARAGAECATCA